MAFAKTAKVPNDKLPHELIALVKKKPIACQPNELFLFVASKFSRDAEKKNLIFPRFKLNH